MKLGYFNTVILSLTVLSTGCLQTRTDVKEVEQRQVMQQQVSTIQKTNADTASRFSDVEEEIRNLNGRIEVLENQIQKNDQQSNQHVKGLNEQVGESNKKSALLQESMIKMEQQLAGLQAEVSALRAEQAAGQARAANTTSAAATAKGGKNSSFDTAQEFFKQKDFKKAIVSYQKYREENPKGKNYLVATYRIGICFQELGLKDEAKTFYEEVIEKFPKSDEAGKSKVRLKRLK